MDNGKRTAAQLKKLAREREESLQLQDEAALLFEQTAAEEAAKAMADLLGTTVRTALLRERVGHRLDAERMDAEIRTSLESLAQQVENHRADAGTFLYHVLQRWLSDLHDAVEFPDKLISVRNRESGRKRALNHPVARSKAVAKDGVRAHFDDWQKGNVAFTSDEAFADVMLEEFPALTSAAVIKRWCGEWRKPTVKHK